MPYTARAVSALPNQSSKASQMACRLLLFAFINSLAHHSHFRRLKRERRNLQPAARPSPYPSSQALPPFPLPEAHSQWRRRERPSPQGLGIEILAILRRGEPDIVAQRQPSQHALHLPVRQRLPYAVEDACPSVSRGISTGFSVLADLEREEGGPVLYHARLLPAGHPPLRHELLRPLVGSLVPLDHPLRHGDVHIARYEQVIVDAQALGRRQARLAERDGRLEAQRLVDDGIEQREVLDPVVGEGRLAAGTRGVDFAL